MQVSPIIDSSREAAPTFREMFPEARPVDHRSLLQKLSDARVRLLSDATPAQLTTLNELIVQCDALEKRAAEFMKTARDAKIAQLQEKHETLWRAARVAEDRARLAHNEAASLGSRLTVFAGSLSQAKQRAHEIDQYPEFNTQFPTKAESAAWAEKRKVAAAALETTRKEHEAVSTALSAARIESEFAANDLKKAIEQLRGVEFEIRDIREKS